MFPVSGFAQLDVGSIATTISLQSPSEVRINSHEQLNANQAHFAQKRRQCDTSNHPPIIPSMKPTHPPNRASSLHQPKMSQTLPADPKAKAKTTLLTPSRELRQAILRKTYDHLNDIAIPPQLADGQPSTIERYHITSPRPYEYLHLFLHPSDRIDKWCEILSNIHPKIKEDMVFVKQKWIQDTECIETDADEIIDPSNWAQKLVRRGYLWELPVWNSRARAQQA